MNSDELTQQIIGCAIRVHRMLGPGLFESVYEECLAFELKRSGLCFERQVPLPVNYREVELDCGYRMDIFVEHRVVVELKAVESLAPVHEAQILTYLKFSGAAVGLLINFNVPLLKQGIKRYVM